MMGIKNSWDEQFWGEWFCVSELLQRQTISEMSNFRTGTILGKGFPEAQVHIVHSTSAEVSYGQYGRVLQENAFPEFAPCGSCIL